MGVASSHDDRGKMPLPQKRGQLHWRPVMARGAFRCETKSPRPPFSKGEKGRSALALPLQRGRNGGVLLLSFCKVGRDAGVRLLLHFQGERDAGILLHPLWRKKRRAPEYSYSPFIKGGWGDFGREFHGWPPDKKSVESIESIEPIESRENCKAGRLYSGVLKRQPEILAPGHCVESLLNS